MVTPPRDKLRIQIVHAGTKERVAPAKGEVLVVIQGSGYVYAERDLVVVRMQRASAAPKGPVDAAMALMQAEPAKRWTVERVARAVGLSRAVFARRFEAAAGTTPMRYLARLRMILAARLLRDTDQGLAEIAATVGYDSEFAFSRAFKRHHGVAPGVFRRESGAGTLTMMRAAA